MQFEPPWILEHTRDVSNVQWLIVSFVGCALLVWVWLKFVGPSMVAGHLAEHQRQVAEAIEQVEKTLSETAEMRNDYRKRLDSIEEETSRRMDEAVSEADMLRDQILGAARETSAGILRRGEQEVARERAKAMVHLRQQFVESVVGAARHAAAGSLQPVDHKRLVEEFVNDLGAKS